MGRDFRGILKVDSKIFKKIFNTIAKSNGFESAFQGWFRESKECVFVVDLMKSNFGNYYLINIKIFINGVFGRDYSKSKELVKREIGNYDRGEPKEYEEALNLENNMSDIEREIQLQKLFSDFIFPLSEKTLTKHDIQELALKGEISLLPAVKEELEKLISPNS